MEVRNKYFNWRVGKCDSFQSRSFEFREISLKLYFNRNFEGTWHGSSLLEQSLVLDFAFLRPSQTQANWVWEERKKAQRHPDCRRLFREISWWVLEEISLQRNPIWSRVMCESCSFEELDQREWGRWTSSKMGLLVTKFLNYQEFFARMPSQHISMESPCLTHWLTG